MAEFNLYTKVCTLFISAPPNVYIIGQECYTDIKHKPYSTNRYCQQQIYWSSQVLAVLSVNSAQLYHKVHTITHTISILEF